MCGSFAKCEKNTLIILHFLVEIEGWWLRKANCLLSTYNKFIQNISPQYYAKWPTVHLNFCENTPSFYYVRILHHSISKCITFSPC
jgi:hypothetical protein